MENLFYTEIQGDLFETDSPVIAHGCNCRGVMGAGVAKIVAQKYPDVRRIYKNLCSEDKFQLGYCQLIYSQFGSKIIANLGTQYYPGADARLNAIEMALENLGIQLKAFDINEVALPMIGCGIGGLKWEDVSVIVKKFAETHKIKTTVYYL